MENNNFSKTPWEVVKRLAKRYFVDAMGGMAYGLLASLIICVVIAQLGKIPGLSILSTIGTVQLKISGTAYSYDLFSSSLPTHRYRSCSWCGCCSCFKSQKHCYISFGV